MSNYLHTLQQRNQLPVVIGLDKSGDFRRFVEVVRDRTDASDNPIFEPDSIIPLSSRFIYERIKPRKSDTMFGGKTYYGKSFLYKSPSGYAFCLTIGPRQFGDGATNGVDADDDHSNLLFTPDHYPTIGAAIQAIYDVELSLYQDSVIPIHMAHDRATIPERVGNKVLSELVDREVDGADRVYR